MPAKPASKNWNDLRALVAALTITTLLGLWNLYATLNNSTPTGKNISAQSPLLSPAASSAQPGAFPGKVLLGGPAPAQKVIFAQHSPRSQQVVPVTQTRSS